MDLQPYLCLFPDCDISHRTFTKRHDWALHESSAHISQNEWLCDVCSEQGTHKDALLVHLEQCHSVLISGTTKQNVKKAESIIYADQACPLCLGTPAKTKNTFFSHVGRHLQEISLAALPASLLMEDDEELIDDSGTEISIEDAHGNSNIQ